MLPLTRAERDARRRRALELVRTHSVTAVAVEVGVSRRTVLRWTAGPRVRSGPGPGRPRTWTNEQLVTFLVRLERIPLQERTTERLLQDLQRLTKHERSTGAGLKLLRRLGLGLERSKREPDGTLTQAVWVRRRRVDPATLR